MSRLGGIRGLADEIIVHGSDESDQIGLFGYERIAFGHGGSDFLFANDAGSFLYGGDDNDLLVAGDGPDHLDGGSEDTPRNSLENGPFIGDIALYENSDSGVYVNLQTGTGRWGDAEGDTLVSIESVAGSFYNDILVGNNEANALWGLEGADNLLGLGGDDILVGGANGPGNTGDFLSGGSGDDIFLFMHGQFGQANTGSDSSAATGIDFIADFGDGDDQIYFAPDGDSSGPVTWSADATNFSVAGSEIWYEHTTDATHGDVTMVHAQFLMDGGGYQYFDIMLDEHQVLVQGDFLF